MKDVDSFVQQKKNTLKANCTGCQSEFWTINVEGIETSKLPSIQMHLYLMSFRENKPYMENISTLKEEPLTNLTKTDIKYFCSIDFRRKKH